MTIPAVLAWLVGCDDHPSDHSLFYCPDAPMGGTWLDTGAGCSVEGGKACRIESCEDSICGGEDRVAYCVDCEVLAEYYRRECEIARNCEWNDGYLGGALLCRFVKH